ncbi:hypothetical protein [Aurantimonas coralicida]|uniref:hypothetical protein n=1 Tax=Aurantimonas coralicida TaxID=182270 RepID=UPI001D198713|nr:hypothetical protein [Aurantimonas coralicida]MCC4296279.1 hypothetical protein [Aurantimonas coralicida]
MESLIAELPDWARVLFYVILVVGGASLFLYRKFQAPPRATAQADPHYAIMGGSLADTQSAKKMLEAIHDVRKEIKESREQSEHDMDRIVEEQKRNGRTLEDIREEMRNRRR